MSTVAARRAFTSAEDWQCTTLGHVAQVKGGKRLPKGEKFADTVTPFPYIRVTDFANFSIDTSDLRYLTPETQATIEPYTISKNDVYISIAGIIGITGMVPARLDGANLTENAAKLVLKEDVIDPVFLMYYLASEVAQTEIRGQTVKNAQPKLALARIASLEIPLPPLLDQRKIANVLGLVHRAIEQQERLIALTGELKKVVLHKLFTEGLRGEPQKQTEIGPMPQSWKVVRLEDSVSITNGQIDPTLTPFSEMLHVGPENIESGTGRLLNLRTNGELRIHSGNYRFTTEDVLYSKIRPYLNKVALPKFEGTCSADMYPLQAKNQQFVRAFLFQLLLSPQFNKQAVSFQDRTGIPKINRAQLGSILLPNPDEAEQLEIAEALSPL